MMKKISRKSALLKWASAATIAAGLAFAPGIANAGGPGWGGPGGGPGWQGGRGPGWHGGGGPGWHGGGGDGGAWLAGALITGAVAGMLLSQPAYSAPPPPVVYAPAYGAVPVYAEPVYQAPAYVEAPEYPVEVYEQPPVYAQPVYPPPVIYQSRPDNGWHFGGIGF